MLSYELAKALQDAGFPQSGSGTRVAPPDVLVARRDDFAYVPTLEELIEACGDAFFAVEKAATWRAQSATAPVLVYRGNTPTEAVARLWLGLNKQ
jgi:hypothetical protein